MKKIITAAVAAIAVAPVAAQAQVPFCAPSDPGGFFACASTSVYYDGGNIVMDVQNLDAWEDMAMTSPASPYGWLMVGIGFRAENGTDISNWFDETLTVTGPGEGDPGSLWEFNTGLSGNIEVIAGGTNTVENDAQPGGIMGCQWAGNDNLDTYFRTCEDMPAYNDVVRFEFGLTNDFDLAAFNAMDWEYGMRGIAGPEDVSFKCGDTDRPCRDVPEPMTMLLLGTGLLGVGFVGYRRREEENQV